MSSVAKALLPRTLSEHLRALVIGQGESTDRIAAHVDIYDAGLNPEGRPAGVFLLLGPTGTGKTKTVEAIAEALHGSPKKLLRIDCAEFQSEHEVAKLIGAPPGYLGHRETQPQITQNRLSSVISNYTDVSIVLFDEIEKAAPSMARLLLGVLDKAILRLGDGAIVNFEKTLVFMTSNLGARQMIETAWSPLEKLNGAPVTTNAGRQRSIVTLAAQRHFAPEFLNRVDATLVYRQLNATDLSQILDIEIEAIQALIDNRLGAERAYVIEVGAKAHAFLLDHGTNSKYGARELKRCLQRELLLPLARMKNLIQPGSTVHVGVDRRSAGCLKFQVAA